MVFAKKVTKAPAVMVETKKMSSKDSCGMGCCGNMKHLIAFVLIAINTLLLVVVLLGQTKNEADKVGGRDNYNMVRQIYQSETFKAQQKQQIEQALQMYQGATQQAATDTTAPTTTQAPTVTPTVAQ